MHSTLHSVRHPELGVSSRLLTRRAMQGIIIETIYDSKFKVVGNINVDNSVLVEKKEEIR